MPLLKQDIWELIGKTTAWIEPITLRLLVMLSTTEPQLHLLPDVEPNELGHPEEAIRMPKPDERNSRLAAKKSGLVKTPQQQSAFAAQNLEDVVMYNVERVRRPRSTCSLSSHIVIYSSI